MKTKVKIKNNPNFITCSSLLKNLHGSIQYLLSLILCIYNILGVNNNFPDADSSSHIYTHIELIFNTF